MAAQVIELCELLMQNAHRSVTISGISGAVVIYKPSHENLESLSRLPDKYIIYLRLHMLCVIGGNALENKLQPAKMVKFLPDNGSFCR